MKPKVFGRVLGGLILLAIGGMFLLRQLGIVSFDLDIGYIASTFWPLILIAVGVQGLSQRGGWGWGLFLLGLGLFFQARNLGFVELTLGEVIRYGWPVLIIYWGLVLIIRPGGKKTSENGWKSYPPKPDAPFGDGDRPVPPPPPLHPNPLDLDFGKDGGSAAGSGSGAGADPGAYGRQGAGGHHGASAHHGPNGWNGAGRAGGPYGAQGWSGSGGPGATEGPYGDQGWNGSGAGGQRGEPGWSGTGAGGAGGAGGWFGPGGGPHRAEDDGRHGWTHGKPGVENRSGFIGDIHIGGDYWELRPMNISLFIGDTVLDLTKAQIPCGETRVNISSFIGDVKVFVPNDRDLGISVSSNSFIGDTKVIDRYEGGFFKNVKFETPYYHEADRRVRLNVSSFIGDVRIVKVG